MSRVKLSEETGVKDTLQEDHEDMDARITRRRFLTGLMHVIAGAGLNSFIPMTLPGLRIGPLSGNMHPYWADVLSKGVHFFPENILTFFSDWDETDFLASPQYTLLLSLNRNKQVLSEEGLPSDRDMGQIVDSSKTSQFMFETIKRIHLDQEDEPGTTYGNDPYHARLLYDLSCFILRDITRSGSAPSFTELSSFDTALLHSGTTYLEEAISMSEHAYDLCDDEFREVLVMNIGSCYNNLGLTLSYLGDIPQARKVFQKALEFRPGDPSIIQNMEDMDSNWLQSPIKIYSRSFMD